MTKNINTKNAQKCAGRRQSIKDATPPWISEEDRLHIERFYEVSAAMSVGDIKYEVDHIIPLNHPLVCGLHIPNNLQIITYDQNKKKGNNIDTSPLNGAITIEQIKNNISIRNKGKFVKGISGNMNGRPRGTGKNQIAEIERELLDEIFEEAGGDAVMFQKLLLKNGHKLKLDLQTALKIARDLASYQTAKKTENINKNEETQTVILQIPGMDVPDKKMIDIKPEDVIE